MAERISVAQAKAHLSELMAEVAYGGKHFIIERRGKPLVAMVKVEELERLEQSGPTNSQKNWALSLVGAWRDLEDSEVDAFIADVYEDRDKAAPRTVDLED